MHVMCPRQTLLIYFTLWADMRPYFPCNWWGNLRSATLRAWFCSKHYMCKYVQSLWPCSRCGHSLRPERLWGRVPFLQLHLLWGKHYHVNTLLGILRWLGLRKVNVNTTLAKTCDVEGQRFRHVLLPHSHHPQE